MKMHKMHLMKFGSRLDLVKLQTQCGRQSAYVVSSIRHVDCYSCIVAERKRIGL